MIPLFLRNCKKRPGNLLRIKNKYYAVLDPNLKHVDLYEGYVRSGDNSKILIKGNTVMQMDRSSLFLRCLPVSDQEAEDFNKKVYFIAIHAGFSITIIVSQEGK